MTIASQTTAETMLGDGANRKFPFTFRAWEDEVNVVLTDPEDRNTDVTGLADIQIAKDSPGGVVTYPAADGAAPLPAGWKLTVLRDMDFLQPVRLVNAARYGNGWIKVSSGSEGNRAWFQVEDDGPGIKPEQREHLFQPFVRGDSARTISGTGLGLAIVQRIIDNHNGKLELGSSERGGLLIRAWLPVPMNRALPAVKSTKES